MRSVDPGESYESWRDAARLLLEENCPPQEVFWGKQEILFAEDPVKSPGSLAPVKVSKAFVEMAQNVSCHCDPSRWALLYRILWRIVCCGERHLLAIASDEDMAKARQFEKNVRREIHKMHAFVRFKLVTTDAESGRERYVAWFEPEHFIVAAGAPFFRKRFANMDWSIFTPKGCVHWDGKQLTMTPGIAENPVENPDALEAAWRTYYRSIFNPARLKVKAMQSEMPKRYWKNLPEADLIEELIGGSKQRVTKMLAEPLRPVKPQPKNAYLDKLRQLSAEE
jgi:uracil-DNA glycosylase